MMRSQTQKMLHSMGIDEHMPSLRDLVTDKPPKELAGLCYSEACNRTSLSGTLVYRGSNKDVCPHCNHAVVWQWVGSLKAAEMQNKAIMRRKYAPAKVS